MLRRGLEDAISPQPASLPDINTKTNSDWGFTWGGGDKNKGDGYIDKGVLDSSRNMLKKELGESNNFFSRNNNLVYTSSSSYLS
jgi:hypothetical protein